MKLMFYTAALITIAAFVSCAGSNDKEYVDKSVIPAGTENTTATQTAVPNAATQTTNVGPVNTNPANTATIPGATTPVNFKPQTNSININPKSNSVATTPQVITAQPPVAVAAGMNPAHGQPGHRCDISVGAPLNSKPAPANAQPPVVTTQPQQPSNVTVKEVPNTVKTAPGMNPPHGEPNHRCDIAVGAPLNSKPTTPAVTTTQTAVPPALLTPPKPDSSKN